MYVRTCVLSDSVSLSLAPGLYVSLRPVTCGGQQAVGGAAAGSPASQVARGDVLGRRRRGPRGGIPRGARCTHAALPRLPSRPLHGTPTCMRHQACTGCSSVSRTAALSSPTHIQISMQTQGVCVSGGGASVPPTSPGTRLKHIHMGGWGGAGPLQVQGGTHGVGAAHTGPAVCLCRAALHRRAGVPHGRRRQARRLVAGGPNAVT
jgi:hypothetical protein